MTYAESKVAPNPFDGLVHKIKEVSSEKGARTIVVKCGARMPTYRSHETLGGATGWEDQITCPECQYHPPEETQP